MHGSSHQGGVVARQHGSEWCMEHDFEKTKRAWTAESSTCGRPRSGVDFQDPSRPNSDRSREWWVTHETLQAIARILCRAPVLSSLGGSVVLFGVCAGP